MATPPYAVISDRPPIVAVTGSAMAQKSVWSLFISRMSVVFIPKTEDTKDSGKKIIVTNVNMRMALELPSSVISILCLSALAVFSRSLRNSEISFSMDGSMK